MFDAYVGVDFSAARDGGRRTWIATGQADDTRLMLVDLIRACELPGAGQAPIEFLPALRRHLAASGPVLAGLDFPFSLPATLMQADSWKAFVNGFAEWFPDPAALRTDCRAAADGRELKRCCDREARTPFSAYNLRLYRQTWWGIGHVLAPMITDPRVSVLPMLVRSPLSLALMEICPASTLKRLGAYGGYKGRTPAAAKRRSTILERLTGEGVCVSHVFGCTAIADSGADALDAIIACYATWHSARTAGATLVECRNDADRLEGRVYV